MINWKISRFATLSADELYDVLQLRSEVFVVEQNCVYQDIDGKDKKAVHLMGADDQLQVYARLFAPGDYFDEASIGRVVVRESARGRALGHELMRRAIDFLQSEYGGAIVISAQQYLEAFYRQHGFVTLGEPYLEDGIPHIRMRRP